MKQTSLKILVLVFMAFVTASSLKLYFNEVQKTRRLSDNIEALNQEAETFKARNGQQAARITAQQITIQELRRSYPELKSRLHNLYIPPGRFQSSTTTSQELRATIAAPILPAPDRTQADELEPIAPRFAYSDKWVKLAGTIAADTAHLELMATDTVFISTYKGERRKPWAWILSRRKIETAATNVNPYIDLNIIQSATLKK